MEFYRALGRIVHLLDAIGTMIIGPKGLGSHKSLLAMLEGGNSKPKMQIDREVVKMARIPVKIG